MRIRNFLATAMSALFLLPGCVHAADKVYEYNFQSPYNGPHVLNVEFFQPWVKEVEEKSGGRLKLHFFMSGTLTKVSDCGPSIMNGNLDIGSVEPGYQDSLFPNTMSFTVPHLVKDCIQGSALIQKAYSTLPEVKAEWNKVGHLLTLWSTDRFGLFSTRGPIRTPSDLKGKRVLIWNGGMVDMLKAWGGIPVQTTSGDTYMALQRGMGDVFFGPLPTGRAYKLMEVAKDITILPASIQYMGLVVNKEVWDELPPDLQNLLTESAGGEQAGQRLARLLYDATNKDFETMRAEGCTIYTLNDAEYEAFRNADRQVSMEYWTEELGHLGLANPAAAIRRAYDMAASTPSAE